MRNRHQSKTLTHRRKATSDDPDLERAQLSRSTPRRYRALNLHHRRAETRLRSFILTARFIINVLTIIVQNAFLATDPESSLTTKDHQESDRAGCHGMWLRRLVERRWINIV